jgi:ABC-2 type transport system permease protein
MSWARVLHAYLTEIRMDLTSAMRIPAFVIPIVLLPAPLYFLFGVIVAGASPDAKAHPEIANWMFTGFATMAVLGPALFGVGCSIAIERDQGLLRLKRAMPSPSGAYLIAKIVMAMIFAAVAAGSVAVAAALGGKITLSAAQLVAIVAVLVAASPACAAIGLFIGTRFSGTATPGLTNLVYFPAIYLSGLFFPLPKALQRWSVIWPTQHMDRLALAVAHFKAPGMLDPRLSAAVLIAVTLVFGALALRRLARVG